jgi:ABC-2 type transport system permease protein
MRDLFVLAARQALGRRRTLIMLIAAGLPLLAAVVYRLAGGGGDEAWVTDLLDALLVTTLLPLVALILGTAALGSEIEDGTIVHLLTKPIPRWWIVASRVAVSTLVSAAVTGGCGALTALVALGPFRADYAFAVAAGIAWGAFVYTCVAVALSSLTGRALILGLLYVFLWEGGVAGLFVGTRLLSVRQYALGVAGLRSTLDPPGAHPDAVASLGLGLLVSAIAIAIAVLRLRSFEATEKG